MAANYVACKLCIVKPLGQIHASRFFQVATTIVVQTRETRASSECCDAIRFQVPLISVQRRHLLPRGARGTDLVFLRI